MSTSQLGLSREIAMGLLEDAILAPSSYNSQPWWFRIRDGGIDLHIDRLCAMPVNDPQDRELTISCGCALFNLRVSAAHAGVPIRVDLLPRPVGSSESGEDDLLARIELGSKGAIPADLAELHPAIARRRTYRRAFASVAVPTLESQRLVEMASLEQAWFAVIGGTSLAIDLRPKAAELISEADTLLWDNPSWRREQASWMHSRRFGQGIAIPGLSLPLARAVVRTFDIGNGIAARDRQLVDGSPLLGVIGTDGDSVEHWLLAGQALQRLLLRGCLDGLQASYLNQPIVVSSLRSRLQGLIGTSGHAQVLLRLGYPVDETPPSARRSLREVVDNWSVD